MPGLFLHSKNIISKDRSPLKVALGKKIERDREKKKNLLIVREEALFFVLGVRHYGALEEDFVARITPCRAFHKMHQFTLRNLENELEPLMFSKLLIHTHPKACHSRFLHVEKYSFI